MRKDPEWKLGSFDYFFDDDFIIEDKEAFRNEPLKLRKRSNKSKLNFPKKKKYARKEKVLFTMND
jgi:hypothetical protein